MEFADQIRIRWISQLIKDISRILQKLLKYINGAGISTLFVLSCSGIFPIIFTLDWNDSVIAALSASPGSFLKSYHELPDVFALFLLYSIKLYTAATRN